MQALYTRKSRHCYSINFYKTKINVSQHWKRDKILQQLSVTKFNT